MKFQEILEKINEYYTKLDEENEGDDSWIYEFTDIENSSQHEELQKSVGVFKKIEHYGGEGDGSTYYDVYHFLDHDIYVKVSGYYQSHNGVDYYDGLESFQEVKPVTKSVVFYE